MSRLETLLAAMPRIIPIVEPIADDLFRDRVFDAFVEAVKADAAIGEMAAGAISLNDARSALGVEPTLPAWERELLDQQSAAMIRADMPEGQARPGDVIAYRDGRWQWTSPDELRAGTPAIIDDPIPTSPASIDRVAWPAALSRVDPQGVPAVFDSGGNRTTGTYTPTSDTTGTFVPDAGKDAFTRNYLVGSDGGPYTPHTYVAGGIVEPAPSMPFAGGQPSPGAIYDDVASRRP